MNTVEHIVECYFRIFRRCFTMHDVKVERGNNRQFDLLAVSLLDGAQYHVESSVTHCERWCPTTDDLIKIFDRKFFGVPTERDGERTDFRRGRSYEREIFDAYRTVGLEPTDIQRVFCCWVLPEEPELDSTLQRYSESKAIRPIQVLSFRDEVLPRLEESVATANYEDEALRTLSLLRQRELQSRSHTA